MDEKRAEIIELLNSKVAFKQDLVAYSEEMFAEFKQVVQNELDTMRSDVDKNRVRLSFIDKGTHEFTIYIGGDALVFQLQRDVYKLPEDNPMWENAYFSKEEANGFFAIINIYNFLADSIELNRYNDIGYLVGRVFVNNDEHFMVEGNGQLGFLFRDIDQMVVNEDHLRKILQCSISYAVEYDMVTPPYNLIREVSVLEIQAISSELQQGLGKTMGFKTGKENPSEK